MTVNKARVVSELLGLGGGDGQLHKLTIYYQRFNLPQGKIEALFNPAEITLTKTARWEQEHAIGQGGSSGNQVDQEFRSVEAETFSIELFFDTYEPRPNTLVPAGQPDPRTDVHRRAAAHRPDSPAGRGEHRPAPAAGM